MDGGPLVENALVPKFAVTDSIAAKHFYCNILGFTYKYERADEDFFYFSLGNAELTIDQMALDHIVDGGHLPSVYPFFAGVKCSD